MPAAISLPGRERAFLFLPQLGRHLTMQPFVNGFREDEPLTALVARFSDQHTLNFPRFHEGVDHCSPNTV